LAGGDDAGDSPVQIVADPVRRILRGRVLAEARVGVGVDQPRAHRAAPGVDDDLGVLRGAADLADDPVLDEERLCVADGLLGIAGDQTPDVLDGDRWHGPILYSLAQIPRAGGARGGAGGPSLTTSFARRTSRGDDHEAEHR